MIGAREKGIIVRLLVVSCAVFGFLRWTQVAKSHLTFPMDLGIETPNVIAVGDIRSGQGVYSRDRIEGPPFHILSYTPLFHALVALLPSGGDNLFFWGRLVSGLFTLGVVGLFGAFGTKDRLAFFLLGAPAFLLTNFVSLNMFIYESASMGLFFSLAAVLCVSLGGRRAAVWAAVLCFLSFMSKQNHVAAAGAIGLYLLLSDWKKAAVFSMVFLGLMGAGLGGLSAAFGEGFWISTFGFMGAPFSTAFLVQFLTPAVKDPVFFGVMLLSVALVVRSTRASPRDTWRRSPLALYLAVSLLVAMTGMRARGGGANYLVEPLAAAIVLSAGLLGRAEVLPDRARVPLLAVFFALCAYKIEFLRPLQYSQLSPPVREDALERRQVIRAEVSSFGLADPRILNLEESPNGLLLSPRVLMSDVGHVTSLCGRGVISMEPLLASVEGGAYDIIVLPWWVSPERPAQHAYLDPLRLKIFEAYSIDKRGAYFNYLRPKPRPGGKVVSG